MSVSSFIVVSFLIPTLFTIGCGESETPQSPEPKPSPIKQEPQKGSLTNAAPLSKTDKGQNIQPPKAFDPLEGKSLKDICSATGLSLIKWPYETLQANFSNLCCTTGGLEEGSMECELDWPFSDVPSCSAYDDMRNEIFARYGRAFSSKQWQQVFGATDWYTVRDDFSDSWLTDTANQNASTLVQLKKNKVSCMD